jgi:hypothetical protein
MVNMTVLPFESLQCQCRECAASVQRPCAVSQLVHYGQGLNGMPDMTTMLVGRRLVRLGFWGSSDKGSVWLGVSVGTIHAALAWGV